VVEECSLVIVPGTPDKPGTPAQVQVQVAS
jgi:hypothetical protein